MFSQKNVSVHFLPIVVVLQIILYITLFINLPLARQIIGIAYLTFIPGLVFLKLLRLKLDTIETIVFSVGFSVAFLMLAGLTIDQFGHLLGLAFPLSTLPLSLLINTIVLVGTAVTYLGVRQSKPPIVETSRSTINPSFLLLTVIPALAVVGTFFVNTTGNNLFLLLMVISIAAIFTFVALRERTTMVFPFAIFMIALALLLHVSLISNYILPYGGDSPAEFFVFKSTHLSGYWNPIFAFPSDQGFGRFNAMLSVTILPTVYSSITGMDPTWVYKIVYPLIFAFVPLALYVLWQPSIGKKLSFFAAFLFMAQSTFFMEMTALTRQMIAELFFVLLLLLLLNKTIKGTARFVGFAVLSFGLIFSHYALAVIFLLLILSAWAISTFYLKKPSFNIQIGTIIFFFVAMFVWYIYVSGSVVFDSFLTFTGYITSQLGDFFNPASRGQTVLAGLGLAESPSILNTVSRGFAYLTELFILIGIVALIRKKTPFRIERDFTVFSLIALAFLVSLTIVPGLANTLNMTRFYHILLMILAPFCIIGIWILTTNLSKHQQSRKILFSTLAVAILVPYFLFQTNFVYEVAQTESWSIPLSSHRMAPLRLYGTYGYIDTYSVYGAQWVSNNTEYQYNIAADNALFTSLTAYGLVYRGYVSELSNTTVLHSGEFVYLSYISTNFEKELSNGTIPRLLNRTSVVYSNGGSEVYFVPAP